MRTAVASDARSAMMPSRYANAPMVHANGLRNLEGPEQLRAVQTLGAGLITVDLRPPRVDRRVSRNQTVDVGEPEEPADVVSPQPPRCRMCSSTGARRIPSSGVQRVALTPPEPPPKVGRHTKLWVCPEYRARYETTAS